MGSSTKSLSSLRSPPPVDLGIGSPTTPAASHQSIVSVGGTKHELNKNALREIEGYTQAFITALQDYLYYFYLEAKSLGQLPLTMTTHLKSVQMDIDCLKNMVNGEATDLLVKDIVNNVQNFPTSDLPTYATLKAEMNWNVEDLVDANDIPAHALKEAESYRSEILNTWSSTTRNGTLVCPSTFAKRAVWTEMQKGKMALLCHRPASNRPHLPLEVMHVAFYEFVRKAELGDDRLAKLADFHEAVEGLCKHLTDPLESEAHRASLILLELRKVFPENACFRWCMEKHVDKGRIDLVYQRILTSEYHPRFPQQPKADYVTNLIIIEIKLEEGSGDAFMQVCRYYGNIVESNPRYHETGAPVFLITMSGPNIKFCGGWADNPDRGASIDVFETHFACLDVAGRHRWELARSLCSLSRAIKLLPLCHIPSSGHIIKDVPSIFTTFTQYNPKAETGLLLLHRLASDVRCSVFGAHKYTGVIPPSGPLAANCVAKLVYSHYGLVVHQALQAVHQAPELYGWSHKPGIQACVYIMDFLRPPSFVQPGWYTLADLCIKAMVATKVDVIYPVLKNIVSHLSNLGLVHGDLRPNNLMIKMEDCAFIVEPVEIKVVDFEWAGNVNIACYPHNRNEKIGYPGKPGGPIGRDDDLYMINKWRKDIEDYRAHVAHIRALSDAVQ